MRSNFLIRRRRDAFLKTVARKGWAGAPDDDITDGNQKKGIYMTRSTLYI